MSDRELLELAAKASGDFTTAKYYRVADDLPVVFMLNDKPWNPLTDDGDALRLAVKLEMNVLLFSGDVRVKKGWNDGSPVFHNEDIFHSDDPYAATRRAIVRAAAEIGKGQA